MTPDDKDRERRLRVVFRRVQHEEIGAERTLGVFCARQARAIDLRECRHCEHSQGLCINPTDGDTFLRCAGGETEIARALDTSPESSPDAPARVTQLRDIMTAPARCVTPELSVSALTAVFLATGMNAAPVVDARGIAIGIVSKTDLLNEYFEREADKAALVATLPDSNTLVLGPGFSPERAAKSTVRDVMAHAVFSLPGEASISRAAALMAYEGVHRIVVTGRDSVAEGVLSSLDILRWLARRDGYVLPDLTRIQSNLPNGIRS
jgi:CBS-domain-containing membrane protein